PYHDSFPTRRSSDLPNLSRVIYSKQILHSDELPYFIQGNGQVILNIKNTNIAPAICYESLQPQHSVKAIHLGAELYIASVAKSRSEEHTSELQSREN